MQGRLEQYGQMHLVYIAIKTHNNIHTVHSESSGVKLTRFKIEGWLELMGMPSVDILYRSDCARPCFSSSQCPLNGLETLHSTQL